MAITGIDFTKQFERRIDKSYNDYYSPPQLADFFKRTLQQAATAKYNELDNQRRFDELRGLLVRNKLVSATSGRIALQATVIQDFDEATGVITTFYPHNAITGQTIEVNIEGSTATFSGNETVLNTTEFTITIAPQAVGTFVAGSLVTPQSITDYMHLFSVQATYKVKSSDTIETVTATPQKVIIELALRSKLRNGDFITIENVVGTTSMNGGFYVQQVKPRKYQLFIDSNLEIPLTANAAYVSGGDIYSIITNACFENKPDTQDIQVIDTPSPEYPKFQISDNALILIPESNVQSATVSYMKNPPIEVDPLNGKTDLSLFYSREFINFWIDMSARLFDLNTRNVQGLNIDTPQIQATI